MHDESWTWNLPGSEKIEVDKVTKELYGRFRMLMVEISLYSCDTA
ncbi:MAG: hypothetical protein ACLR2O_05410 [Coprococcus sp.]